MVEAGAEETTSSGGSFTRDPAALGSRRKGLTMNECVWCGEPLTNGCNTALCSEACEMESAMVHERAHAGVSDPDDHEIDDCPLDWRD